MGACSEMEHKKIYHRKSVIYHNKELIVEGPVSPQHLQRFAMHPKLNAFRRPNDQLEALIEIAGLTEGRISIARDDQTIIGYVTFHYPDELERWSEGNIPELLELGAVEVADDFRGIGLGKHLMQLSFLKNQLDNMIVFATEYYWHWDLTGSGLDVWAYRKMMERLMRAVDMVWFATDDPEICAHPANCLMVRIGKRVSPEAIERFDRVRFQRRIMY